MMKKSASSCRGPGSVERRKDGGVVRAWAALALALVAGPMLLTQDGRAVGGGAADASVQSAEAAARWLQRAGDALGGAERLHAIDRLSIEATEWRSRTPQAAMSRSFKLWLPDRFKSHVAGIVTHTLNAGRVTFDRDVAADVQRNAERAVPAMFRRLALAFLLRAPGLSAPRLEGEVTIAGMTGTLIAFSAADDRTLKLLLAPTTAQPVALVYSARVMGSAERLPDRIWRLEDYRVVDGVSLPFRLTTVHPTNELILQVRQIAVNPPYTAADFAG